jgi:hypothetical protein
MAQRWGARLDSHQHTHLFTGQATRGVTISVRRHGCVVRGMCIVSANAWDAMWGTLGVYATARGRLLQVASDEIRWRQASWPNFINGANSALLSPRTQSFYQTIPCESHVIGSSNTSAVTSLRARPPQRVYKCTVDHTLPRSKKLMSRPPGRSCRGGRGVPRINKDPITFGRPGMLVSF